MQSILACEKKLIQRRYDAYDMIQSDAINTGKVRLAPLNLKDWEIVSDREYKRKLLVKEALQKSSKTNNSLMDDGKTYV